MTIGVFFKNFVKDESGAVTTDWVVLTAAIVGLGVLVVAPFATAIDEGGEKIKVNIMDSVSKGLNDTKL